MAVELKTDEEVIVTQTLNLSEEIDDEIKRPLGLACHSVVEDFEWDPEDPGHVILQKLLRDIKNALGVRVSKQKAKKKKASKKKAKSKKAAQSEDSSDKGAEDSSNEASGPNGDADPGEVADASPPDGAPASTEESTSTEDQSNPDAGAEEDSGSEIHDPFAVPPGSQS